MNPVLDRHQLGPMVLYPVGDVDHYSAEPLRSQIKEAVSCETKGLIISLEDVPFIDSTGLGLLVGVMKQMAVKESPFHVVCVNNHILSMLRITGLDKAINIHESLIDAILAATGENK